MRPYLYEARAEFLSALRTPRYSLATVLFPAMFYIFFGIIMKVGNSGLMAMTQMTAMCAMGGFLSVTSCWEVTTFGFPRGGLSPQAAARRPYRSGTTIGSCPRSLSATDSYSFCGSEGTP